MKRQALFPQRIEGIRSPAMASHDMLRMCRTERDAVLASITISGLTYSEIGARIGVSKQAVEKWARNGLPKDGRKSRVAAFCNATGTRLVEQFLVVEAAMREAEGRIRERDHINAIVRCAA